MRSLILAVFLSTLTLYNASVGASLDNSHLYAELRSRMLDHNSRYRMEHERNSIEKALGFGLKRGQARKLTQTPSTDTCAWGSNGECGLSIVAVLRLLNEANNSVADYIHRLIVCRSITAERLCETSECVWVSSSGCFIPHEAIRDFHSVNCVKKIEHVYERSAGNHQCRPIETEVECAETEPCHWTNNNDVCRFDEWYYYYGIRTVDLFPEGFQEVFGALGLHISNEIRASITRGEIVSWPDLLTWEAPPFECPPGFDKVVCDFVIAFTPTIVSRFYCSLEYDTAFEVADCERDPQCTADTTDPDQFCSFSQSVFFVAYREASLVFANSIDDPEAKIYESKQVECNFIPDEDECNDQLDCIWLNNFCEVTDQWIANEIHRLIGKSKDPVCQYLTLDVSTGCVDKTSEKECEDDSKCFYSSSTRACRQSILTGIRFGLEVSGLEQCYDATEKACSAVTSEIDCDDVPRVTDCSTPPIGTRTNKTKDGKDGVDSDIDEDESKAFGSLQAEDSEEYVVQMLDNDVMDDGEEPATKKRNRKNRTPTPTPSPSPSPSASPSPSSSDQDLSRAGGVSIRDIFGG